MPFDPLFDKLPPKGQRGQNRHVGHLDEVAFYQHHKTAATATVAVASTETPPNSPFTGKPMVAAKVAGVPVFVDLDSKAVYPVQV